MHLYTQKNLYLSLFADMADAFRAAGYDVLWHESNVKETQTKGLTTPLGTISLVRDIPANPTYLQRLKDDSAGSEIVVVPAFTLTLAETPWRGDILGLGHKDYEWMLPVLIDGFAADSVQHLELTDVLNAWLNEKEDKELAVSDYTVPASPVPLTPVRVMTAVVTRSELDTGNDAARYYIRADVRLTFDA